MNTITVKELHDKKWYRVLKALCSVFWGVLIILCLLITYEGSKSGIDFLAIAAQWSLGYFYVIWIIRAIILYSAYGVSHPFRDKNKTDGFTIIFYILTTILLFMFLAWITSEPF
ncbi:MAG: hypothetical protein PHU71_05485 [Candidatus Gracilibacteria bacterium]|nr:hypothetical protein [Candidatus Gracilibacteria bacterium]